MSDDDDDEVPQLSADTAAILQEFLNQKSKEDISEDWQLSQFWYDEETTTTLANAVYNLTKQGGRGRVALISCPTLMQPVIDKGVDAVLFEFDQRFVDKFPQCSTYYDYRQPERVASRYFGEFDIIVLDPPFLSEECLTKVMETVKIIRDVEGTRLILCTGAVMEKLALQLGQLKPCSFLPKHKNNLGNEFRCYTNFGELPADLK